MRAMAKVFSTAEGPAAARRAVSNSQLPLGNLVSQRVSGKAKSLIYVRCFSQPQTSAVHNSELTDFNQSTSEAKLNNFPAYQVVDTKQFQIISRILKWQ